MSDKSEKILRLVIDGTITKMLITEKYNMFNDEMSYLKAKSLLEEIGYEILFHWLKKDFTVSSVDKELINDIVRSLELSILEDSRYLTREQSSGIYDEAKPSFIEGVLSSDFDFKLPN